MQMYGLSEEKSKALTLQICFSKLEDKKEVYKEAKAKTQEAILFRKSQYFRN